jgi:hypothetical protein
MNPRSWWPAVVTAVVTAVIAAVVLITGVLAPDSTTASGRPGTKVDPAAQPAQALATMVKRISPLTAHGHLRSRYAVTATRRGHCWTTSLVNGRLYRCLAGNSILDPCWKQPGRHAVVCLPRPWSTKLTRLRLTKPLPDTDRFGPRIWGIRLGGGVGVNCLVSMGAAGAVGKEPMSYLCRRGWVLLGEHPDRRRPLWTMLTARQVRGHYVPRGRKPLPVAWKAVLR